MNLPSWPAAQWPTRGFGIQTAENIAADTAKSLGGALFLPDVGNCWQDTGKTTPCTYDSKVAHIDDVTGLFTTTQPTTNSQPYLRSANYSVLPFTSETGEVWSVTRPSTLVADSGGFEWANGEAYWRNPAGLTGHYASTPDSAATSITGDFTFIVSSTTDWTSTPNYPTFFGKDISGSRGFTLFLNTINLPKVNLSFDGSTTSEYTPGLVTGFTAWQTGWLKVTRVQSTGVIKFYTSIDGATWTQLGTDVAGSTSAIFDSTAGVVIGRSSISSTNQVAGKIHYAAAWANATGEGTPAWEFHPTRDAVKPASPYLDFDGINDYLISSIIPGNYSAGFVCAGAVQTEAIGGTNALFGTTSAFNVHGIRLSINSTGYPVMSRVNGGSTDNVTLLAPIAQNSPFTIDTDYQETGARLRLNGVNESESAVASVYTGTTQYALIGTANSAESGATPAILYFQGNIHALAWLPSIPTEAQETSIRSYIASKTGVTL